MPGTFILCVSHDNSLSGKFKKKLKSSASLLIRTSKFIVWKWQKKKEKEKRNSKSTDRLVCEKKDKILDMVGDTDNVIHN